MTTELVLSIGRTNRKLGGQHQYACVGHDIQRNRLLLKWAVRVVAIRFQAPDAPLRPGA